MGKGLSMGSGGSALGHAAFPWGCLGSILPISQEIPGVAGGISILWVLPSDSPQARGLSFPFLTAAEAVLAA